MELTTTPILAHVVRVWLPTTKLGSASAALFTVLNAPISVQNLNRNWINSSGNAGVGIISDNDPQPIIINSHLGKFAIVTVAYITNLDDLEKELLDAGVHFGELSSGRTNQTELVAPLINQGRILQRESAMSMPKSKVRAPC